MDDVYFDRIKDGVLGNVKGDYSAPLRFGSEKAARELLLDAERQTAVASKHGLPLEWHVMKYPSRSIEMATPILLAFDISSFKGWSKAVL